MSPWPTGILSHALRCPVCRAAIRVADGTAVCSEGHRFDFARQGNLTLRGGQPAAKTGDSTQMVAARDRFLARAHYAPIAERLAELVAHRAQPLSSRAGSPPPVVLDLAGGTGYYLARVLDALPGAYGLCVDLSAPALRRAARAHPRILAVGSDLWQGLPVQDRAVTAVMSVFGPRNVPEIERVLVPGGVLVALTPTPDHLRELVGPLGMLRVGTGKQERLETVLGRFEPVGSETLRYRVAMDHGEIADLVGMGPSAHHVSAEETAERLRALPDPVEVTVSVHIGVHRLRVPDRAVPDRTSNERGSI